LLLLRSDSVPTLQELVENFLLLLGYRTREGTDT
jgi:hypothetical protein